jgi:hypothetical protein
MATQERRAYSRRAALGALGKVGVASCGLIGASFSNLSSAAGQTEPSPQMPAEVLAALPDAQALGSATLRFLGLSIYEARLWVQRGFQASSYAQSPFALELNYSRSLSGPLIAERSLKEMRRQGPINEERGQIWLRAMVQAFPDVKAGDRITGLHTPGVGARFWFNGQSRPAVDDPDFSRFFFGIWLSEETSEPQMRARLLGKSAS